MFLKRIVFELSVIVRTIRNQRKNTILHTKNKNFYRKCNFLIGRFKFYKEIDFLSIIDPDHAFEFLQKIDFSKHKIKHFCIAINPLKEKQLIHLAEEKKVTLNKLGVAEGTTLSFGSNSLHLDHINDLYHNAISNRMDNENR